MAQTPIPNMQASVALTQYFPLQGVFPGQGGGGAAGFYLGEIGTFAGFFAPAGATATGQLAAVSQNLPLFSLLGITYGGNGTTSFGLPNLAGVTMVGTGQGAGLSPETLGQKSGSESVTINYPQAPPNLLGQSQAIDNHQPSLGITYAIEIQGVFPTQGGGGLTPLNTLGMIKAFAGNFDAAGYAACNGQLLSIAQNQALFSILGTTYGGNGITTFALPDLRGRDIIGASATTPIGTKVGQANVNLANGQAPTEGGGPVTPFDNRQPSLSIQYIIALQGIFPSQGGNQDPLTPFLGQIVAFAGNFVPSGWARCDGTILSISQNTALFSLLGTAHGGNGTTTFGLPDLRDRTVIGTGNGFVLGEIDGENSSTITAAELAVPAPRYGGALVTPGQFDTWLPIDSVQIGGGGYQIAWKHGAANEYLVWNTDGNGNWLSQGASMSGTSFALESLEPTFGYDLNGDGTVGVVTTTIEAFGATDLKQVANNYYVYAHGTTTGPQLKMSGVAVTEGQNGAWTPISAEPSGGGYKVVWKNGGANEYLVWTIDGSGNWLSQTAVMSGTTYAMQSLETAYSQDLNGDGTVGPHVTTIEAIGLTDLKQLADTYFLYDHGTTTGPQLKMSGAAVTVGQNGTWTPIGVEKMGSGYLAVWKHGALDEYLTWTIDSGGNWLSQTGAMSGTTYALQSLETTFGQDLNGDLAVGPAVTTIEAIGSTDLKQVANTYFLYDHGTATGPQLKMSGAAVTVGQNGTWTPIGAEKMGGGYLAVWKHGALDEYLTWAIDGGGNWLSQSAVVPGASAEIQSLEPGFGQNLNGVGGITARAVIEAFGATTLATIANVFVLSPTGSSLGPQIRLSGALVTVGQNGTWTPIAAEAGGGGYQVAWKNGALDEYLTWTLDSGGNWLSQTGAMSGTTYALQSLETTFSQDLNGDLAVGPAVTTIEAIGTVDLKQVADTYFLYDHTSINGPQLKVSGAAVTVGQNGTWTPIGAEKMGGGYLAVWKHGALDEYLTWAIDSGGNWLSQSAVVPGASAEIQSLEPGFGQNLNGVGGITARAVIEAFGATTLANIANVFVLSPTGSSLGPQIRLSGALVTVGQNGAWTPIAAEAGGGGYQVAWKNGALDEYLVWTTDGSGNWLSQTAVMSGSSATMKAYETTFQQDLNLNGMVGNLQIDEETAGLAAAGGDQFQWNPGDGNGTVEGHAGFDTMLINGANVAENIDILASGGHVLFHRDVANVTVDLNGVEKIDFHALGGTDNIVVGDLGGTGVTNVALDLGGPGGGGDGAADTVTVNATQGDDVFAVSGDADGVFVTALQAQVNILFPEAANDRLIINGLDGSDTIDATNLAADGIQLTMDGGAGNDVLLGSQGDDLIDGGDGNDVAFMAAGNDTFVWNPGDDSDTVEGQAGFDTLQFNGADVAENIDISANGGRVVFSCNVGDVVMDLNGIESIDFNSRGGADTIVVNELSGTGVSQININLAAAGGAGDGQADTIVINATHGDHAVLVADGGSGAITVQGLAATVHITGFEAAHDRIVIDGHILLGADLFG